MDFVCAVDALRGFMAKWGQAVCATTLGPRVLISTCAIWGTGLEKIHEIGIFLIYVSFFQFISTPFPPRVYIAFGVTCGGLWVYLLTLGRKDCLSVFSGVFCCLDLFFAWRVPAYKGDFAVFCLGVFSFFLMCLLYFESKRPEIRIPIVKDGCLMVIGALKYYGRSYWGLLVISIFLLIITTANEWGARKKIKPLLEFLPFLSSDNKSAGDTSVPKKSVKPSGKDKPKKPTQGKASRAPLKEAKKKPQRKPSDDSLPKKDSPPRKPVVRKAAQKARGILESNQSN